LAVPWYWTDDIARALVSAGRTGEEAFRAMLSMPVAIRRDEPTIEAVIEALVDEGEIPLAA
jgi:hypothetical protein